MENLSIRLADSHDLSFLREMLYEAVFWRRTEERPPLDEALARPELSKLLYGWGKQGDTALVGVFNSETRIGAAWYRFWTQENHTYGFVDAKTPELGIAVRSDFRGRGVGTLLLRELLNRAHQDGITKVSLSVEPENRASRLYDRIGFRPVGKSGTSVTMVLALP